MNADSVHCTLYCVYTIIDGSLSQVGDNVVERVS